MNSVSGKSVVTTPVLSYAHQSLGYHIVTIRFWKRSTLIHSLQNNSIATNTCNMLKRIHYLSFRTFICEMYVHIVYIIIILLFMNLKATITQAGKFKLIIRSMIGRLQPCVFVLEEAKCLTLLHKKSLLVSKF